MERSRVKPQLYSRKQSDHHKDNRLSVCSDCRTGIFVDHKYIWTARGLVHIDCTDKVGVNALKDVS